MAARKSCTHLTWGEAKAKSGVATAKKKVMPKNTNHAEALTHKIISKNGPSREEADQARSLLRKARREDERAAHLNAKRDEERALERASQVVKPHEQARQRLHELALEYSAATVTSEPTRIVADIVMDVSEMKLCAECKQMQLDEIMGLQAIFMDTDDFLVAESANLEELRTMMEEHQMDEDNESLLRSVVGHHPLSIYLQQSIEDANNPNLVASMLLRVTYPPLYPLGGSTPQIDISYFMVTDRTVVCSADKPLETLAYLDERRFQEAIQAESQHLLPDPSVYEVVASWLPEHLFSFVTMHTHATLK